MIRNAVPAHVSSRPVNLPVSPKPSFDFRSAAIAFAACYVLLVLLILMGVSHARTSFDQDQFHLKVIERFSAQWPRFDLRDYLSATTPGYHVVLATLHHFVTASVLALRLLAAMPTAGIIAVLVGLLAARRGVAEGFALALPLLCCSYILQSGLYLLPDNTAWLLVLCIIGLSLSPVQSARRWAVSGGLLVLLVLTRQIHIWAAAAVWMGAFASIPRQNWYNWRSVWLGGLQREVDVSGTGVLADWPTALKRAISAAMCTAPAFAMLAGFVLLWGGLTPPLFRSTPVNAGENSATNVSGLSPATPAFMLALLSIYGVAMLPLIWPCIRIFAKERWFIIGLCLAAGVGFALAALPETTQMVRPRVGGLWTIVKAMQDRGLTLFGRTSPLILVMSTVGGAAVFTLLALCGRQARWVLLTVLVAFVAAGTAQALSWQRYFEPLLLMWVALAAASRVGKSEPLTGGRLLGPAVLALGLAGLSSLAFWGVLG